MPNDKNTVPVRPVADKSPRPELLEARAFAHELVDTVRDCLGLDMIEFGSDPVFFPSARVMRSTFVMRVEAENTTPGPNADTVTDIICPGDAPCIDTPAQLLTHLFRYAFLMHLRGDKMVDLDSPELPYATRLDRAPHWRSDRVRALWSEQLSTDGAS